MCDLPVLTVPVPGVCNVAAYTGAVLEYLLHHDSVLQATLIATCVSLTHVGSLILACLHLQVGKAWLLLSKIYQSNPAQASQVMAEAALVRSWEVYALCQGAAQPEDLTPATVQSFSHLLEKIQRNPDKLANVSVATPHQQRVQHQQQQQQQHQRLLQQQQQQLQIQQLQQLRQQQQAQLQLQTQRQQQAQQMPVSSQAFAVPAQTQLQQQAQAQAHTQLQQQAQAHAQTQPQHPTHTQTQLQQQTKAQAQGVGSVYGARQWPGPYAPSQAVAPGQPNGLHRQLSAQLQVQQQQQPQQQPKQQQASVPVTQSNPVVGQAMPQQQSANVQ